MHLLSLSQEISVSWLNILKVLSLSTVLKVQGLNLTNLRKYEWRISKSNLIQNYGQKRWTWILDFCNSNILFGLWIGLQYFSNIWVQKMQLFSKFSVLQRKSSYSFYLTPCSCSEWPSNPNTNNKYFLEKVTDFVPFLFQRLRNQWHSWQEMAWGDVIWSHSQFVPNDFGGGRGWIES